MSWFEDLFINEAKPALNGRPSSGGSSEGGNSGPCSWNDLKDKPFGESVTEGVITFDGDLTGWEQLDGAAFGVNDGVLIKVSDTYTSKEQLEGATITYMYGSGNIWSKTLNNVREDSLPTGEAMISFSPASATNAIQQDDVMFVAIKGDLSAMGMPLKEGTYFVVYPEDDTYIMSISCLTGPVASTNPIDEKFIPDTIARTSEVVPAPATASVGQTVVVKAVDENGKPTEWAAADMGVGEGSSYTPSDWNAAEGEPGHVLNRTHYEDYAFDIKWNGDMTDKFAIDMSMFGYDDGQFIVKVSDIVFDDVYEQVAGGVVEYNNDMSIAINIGNITSENFPGCYMISDYVVYVYDGDLLSETIGAQSGTIENGIYFTMDVNIPFYVTRFRGRIEIKTLDEKWLPDTVALKNYVSNEYVSKANIASYYTIEQLKMLFDTEIKSNQFKYNHFTHAYSPSVTSIGENAFSHGHNLIGIDFPNVEHIYGDAFYSCTKLKTVNIPKVLSIDSAAFTRCINLESIRLPNVLDIDTMCFFECTKLSFVDISTDNKAITMIRDNSFGMCTSLKALILRSTSKMWMSNYDGYGVANGTPIANGTGYIYVPSALIEQYKVAENWSTYASQFRALEDYTVDGTITGELDETKI